MKDILKKSLKLSIILLIICGILYPLVTTGTSQLLFSKRANGSMITFNGKEIGSSLIGQDFKDPRFFHGRVSAINYNTYKDGADHPKVTSGSENLGPSSEALTDRVKKAVDELLKQHPEVKKEDIPLDLVTSSASGLDPEISIEAAKFQVPSVSKAAGISEEDLQKLIDKCTIGKSLGFLGENRVNVLLLNIEVAKLLK